MDTIPFYMTYPMQNLYVMELEYEKDMERMKAFYPSELSYIQRAIEDRCDELEFEGSRIFDEEPDKFMIQKEINTLYDSLYFSDFADYSMIGQSFSGSQRKCDDWLCSMLGILFTNELYRRRCRHRRCSRWW